MADSYLVCSLKRVHDQAAEALKVEGPTSSVAIAERFNQVLEDFQTEYPDNDRLARIGAVDGTRALEPRHHSLNAAKAIEGAKEDLRKMKLRTGLIADLFGLDSADFERVNDVGEMQPIVINQNTSVSQETAVSQTVEYTQLVEMVDQAMLTDDDTENLKNLIEEFHDELEDEEPDESRLRDLVHRAKQYGAGVGTQVAVQLTMAGLKAGIDLVP